MRHPISLGIAALLSFLAGCDRAAPTPAANPVDSAQPAPALTSADVVRHQMLALQHNDVPHRDAGAAIAFRFASPENRVFTGPVERFAGMMRSPVYAPMLNCRAFDVAEADVQGDLARHLVLVDPGDNRTFAYVFVLRKQTEGEFADCWMVDSVVPVQPPPHIPDPGQPGEDDDRPRRIAV